jgi:tripartite-type tricarboxylate transporter receptor subunit TctC
MAVTRRAVLASASASLFPFAARADEYPSRPIRIIVGYSAGSGIDVDARIIGKQLTETMGQPVVVDNKPGAFTNLAAGEVARSQPDGYTLLVSGHVTITSNIHLFKSLPFDPVKDFTPITLLGKQTSGFAVPTQSPARSLAELAAYLKTKGEKASYGYSGTLAFMTVEWFKKITGAPCVGVPYKNTGDSLTGLVRGEIDLLVYDIGILTQQERDGQLRVLAVTSTERSSLRPDLPGTRESGLPDSDLGPWVGVWGPGGMPPAMVERLGTTILKVWDHPDEAKALNSLSVERFPLPPEKFPQFVQGESAKWARVIETLKIEPQ